MGGVKPEEKPAVVQIEKGLYFGPIHVNNIGLLRRLNEHVLPVTYQDSFYNTVKTSIPQDLAKLAVFKDLAVGAICCRVEQDTNMLYIMTLCVLPKYRYRGIGRKLVETIVEAARKTYGCKGAYLHVWTTNTDAIKFYEKLGFRVKETAKGYYKKVDPPDAFIVEKIF